MTATHVPVLAARDGRSPGSAARRRRSRLHVRRRRPRACDRRAPRARRPAHRDRPRSRCAEARFDEFAAEVACATRFMRARLRRGAGDAAPTRACGPTPSHGPRHVLDAGRHARARLLLRLRRAARHADGPDAASSPRARSSTSGTSASLAARCASWARSATPARSPAAIVRARARGSIDTTTELVDVVTAAIPAPARFAGGHPAKRTFQAIRIAVNDELGQLDSALPLAWRVLGIGGRFAGISFHSAGRPAREALPGRPRARVHLPARPPGVRVRRRAARPSCSTAGPSSPDRPRSPRTRGPPSARLRAARKLKDTA